MQKKRSETTLSLLNLLAMTPKGPTGRLIAFLYDGKIMWSWIIGDGVAVAKWRESTIL